MVVCEICNKPLQNIEQCYIEVVITECECSTPCSIVGMVSSEICNKQNVKQSYTGLVCMVVECSTPCSIIEASRGLAKGGSSIRQQWTFVFSQFP